MDRRTAIAGLGIFGVASALARPASALGEAGSAAILEAGAFSMQTSQLAQERSRNSAVRQFAELEANEQAATAAALGVQPGSVPIRPERAAMLQQLSGLSGSRFDAMYIRGQIMGHQELLALNQAAVKAGMGGREQAVALVAVPAIQTHLYLLQGMRRG